MTTYWYSIEAPSAEEARYMRCILRAHGFLYPWSIRAAAGPSKRNVIRVAVGKASTNSNSQAVGQSLPVAELIISNDDVVLQKLGLSVQTSVTCADFGYLFSTEVTKNEPETALALAARYFCAVNVLDSSWSIRCLLMGTGHAPQAVVVSRSETKRVITVLALDLLGLIGSVMYGPPGDSTVTGHSFEDWADAYGIHLTQSRARTASVDRIIFLIRTLLTEMCPNAFPVEVDYYPVGKSAPLLITGDTDDATVGQLDEYITALEQHGARGTIILKQFEDYSKASLLSAKSRGHAFGVHPFGEPPTREAYRKSFSLLHETFHCLFAEDPCAVRNHRFQWVGRTECVNAESQGGVLFDLNCIASNCRCWLGTGSGVGFPIPYPPLEGHFSRFPLHLPTVIEDDVLMYDLEYCYRPFQDGALLPADCALSFLDNWVLDERYPAVVNAHPEHITPTLRHFLDSLLYWADRKKVWMPSLREFGVWLKKRDECSLSVHDDHNGSRVSVTAPTAVELQFYPSRTRQVKRFTANAGLSWWQMTPHSTVCELEGPCQIPTEGCND